MAFQTETVDDLFARFGQNYRIFVTVSGMTASFVMVLSGTIVNVAVPDVMGAYGVGQYQAQLLATSFNVAMTTCQLLNAWVVAVLGQRYGYIATLIFLPPAASLPVWPTASACWSRDGSCKAWQPASFNR